MSNILILLMVEQQRITRVVGRQVARSRTDQLVLSLRHTHVQVSASVHTADTRLALGLTHVANLYRCIGYTGILECQIRRIGYKELQHRIRQLGLVELEQCRELHTYQQRTEFATCNRRLMNT